MLMKEQVTGLPRVTNPCTKRSPTTLRSPTTGRRGADEISGRRPHTHTLKKKVAFTFKETGVRVSRVKERSAAAAGEP